MSDYYDRLKAEQSELHERVEKLRAFIWDGSDIYKTLSLPDQALLINQLHVMKQYKEILRQRLERIVYSAT